MSSSTSTTAAATPHNLLGRQIDGLNGLRLAVFQRYADLHDLLRPLEEAGRSAYLDDDMRLFRIYSRCNLDRVRAVETWMERSCRLLRIKDIDEVIEAIDEEVQRDALLAETFELLRDAHRKADARAAEAQASSVADAAKTDATAEEHFSQNEIGRAASPHPAPPGAADVVPPGAEDPGSGAAPSEVKPAARPLSPPGGTVRDNTIVQNEVRRPPRLQLRGAGSWSEPRLLPPLTIKGRDVYPRELDPDEGDTLFE